jgi:alpha-tubulin suppressor-like RCC1 family protein
MNSNSPVQVNKNGALNNLKFISISSGYFHTCAIANDQNVYCWGRNEYIKFFI